MPTKKTNKEPRPIRSRNSPRAKSPRRFPWAINPRAAIIGVSCVLAAAAVLLAARQPAGADIMNVGAQPETHFAPESHAQLEQQEAAVARPGTKKAVLKMPAAPSEAQPHTVNASLKSVPMVESVKAVPAAAAAAPVIDSMPKAQAEESTPKASVANVTSVTIRGCLELDDQTFWLKDTAGVAAPASRTWRSGFLTKRPARIEVVDAGKALKLPNYVGQRVAATGTLVNHEMQARSLHRVTASCD